MIGGLERFRTARPRLIKRDGKCFVERDGGLIEVLIDNPDPPPRNKKIRFAPISLEWAAAVAKKTNSPSFAIKVALAHMAWENKSQTFALSNNLRRQLGVSREGKRRALASLEKGRVIRIERQGHRSPIVTMLIET
jgi:hypothetical protein